MNDTERDGREHLAGVIKGWARQGGVGYDTLADAILHSEWLRRHDAAVTARAHAPIRAVIEDWDVEHEGVPWRMLRDLRAALDPAAATQHDTDIARQTLTDRLAAQREWSLATFGPGDRLAGLLDHLRKELAEVEANPADVSEWIDLVILAFDGAWRSGHTPEQIVAALDAKYEKNRKREWPDWRTAPEGKAIEHVRDHAAALGQPHGQTGNNHE